MTAPRSAGGLSPRRLHAVVVEEDGTRHPYPDILGAEITTDAGRQIVISMNGAVEGYGDGMWEEARFRLARSGTEHEEPGYYVRLVVPVGLEEAQTPDEAVEVAVARLAHQSRRYVERVELTPA